MCLFSSVKGQCSDMMSLLFQSSSSEINKQLQDIISKNPQLGIKGTFDKKTNDNKVKTYLESAQSKFPDSPSDLNILVISLPSNELQKYYLYIGNPYSGILNGGLDQFDLSSDQINRIDYVMLTNIVSGHDKFVNIDVWDLNNYCIIFLKNPYSIGLNNQTKRIDLLNVFPNDCKRIWEYKCKIAPQYTLSDYPIDEWILNSYLVDNYSDLYNPNETRKFWF